MRLKNIEVEKSNLFTYLRKKVSTMEMLVPPNEEPNVGSSLLKPN